MILKTKYISLLLAAVFSSLSLSAQTMSSLMLGQDPASLALGMTGVASDGTAFALQNNVAAIALGKQTLDVQAGMGIWQPSYANLKTIGGGAIYRTGRLGFGLDFKTLKMPTYTGVSGNGADIRDSEFTPTEMNLAAGASYALMDILSAGVTLRYASSKLAADAQAAVFGADVAVYYNNDGIRAGLSVNNIGSKVQYSETSYSQPMMAKIGGGYDIVLGSSALAFNAEVDVFFAGGIMAGAGCEYSFKEMVCARVGYHYGDSVNVLPSCATAGLGIKLFGAQVNLSYLFGSSALSDSICLSLGYTF